MTALRLALRTIREVIADPDWRPWFIRTDTYVARLYRRVLLAVLAAVPLLLAATALAFAALWDHGNGELYDAAHACMIVAAGPCLITVWVSVCQMWWRVRQMGRQ